jgi:hypothetical protein
MRVFARQCVNNRPGALSGQVAVGCRCCRAPKDANQLGHMH